MRCMHRISFLVLVGSVLLPLFSRAQPKSDAKLTEVRCSDAETPAGVTIANVTVKSKWKDGLLTVRIKAPTTQITANLERSASVFVSDPDHKFIIIHEHYASNEDRLWAYDLTTAGR